MHVGDGWSQCLSVSRRCEVRTDELKHQGGILLTNAGPHIISLHCTYAGSVNLSSTEDIHDN